MAKKQNAPAVEAEQQPEAVEATEAQAPEGVVETEETLQAAAEQSASVVGLVDAKPEGYVVQWHIKTDGQRYAPGDVVELSAEAAAPFLASGAIVLK